MVSLLDAAYGYSLLTKLILGSFTVLFIAALWVIFQKRSGINMNLLSTVIIIWILATVVSSPAFPRLLIVLFISQHLILDIVRAVQAFVDADGTALDYYSNLSNPLQAAKTAIYVILTLVGDGFAVSRCVLHLLASLTLISKFPRFIVVTSCGIASGISFQDLSYCCAEQAVSILDTELVCSDHKFALFQ